MGRGADHLRSIRVPMSPLGERVADLVDQLVSGIYHWPRYQKQDWSTDLWITLKYDRGMATFDNNMLTALVFLAHEYCMRVEISPCMRNLEVQFHQRKGRDGGLSARHPTLEQAVERFVKNRPWCKELSEEG